MAELNTELMRSRQCERSFRFLMWGFLFLLPVPLPVLREKPDVLAWILILPGLFAITELHAEVRRLQIMAAIGLALWFPRFVVPYTGVPRQEGITLLLYAASWVVVFVFAWRLCELVRRMALASGADSLARGAEWRKWTPLVMLVLLGVSPAAKESFAPALAVSVAFLLAGLIVVLAFISLMSTASRLCAQLRTEAQSTGPPASEEPEPWAEE